MGTYPDKSLMWKYTHTPIFMVKLLIKPSQDKGQPQCPSIAEWQRRCNPMEYSHKMNEVVYAVTGTGLEMITLSAVRQTNTIWHQSRESEKWYKGAYVQNRKGLTDIENKLTVTKEEMRGEEGRDKLGAWN